MSLLGRLFGSAPPAPQEDGAFAAAQARREADLLRERAQMLGDVWNLDQASDILLFLEEGLITEANEAAVRAYGYTREDLCGRLIFDLFPPEFRDECRSILGRRERISRAYQTTHVRRNGQTFPVELSFRATQHPQHRSVLAVIHDVTGRAQAEQDVKAAQRQAGAAAHAKAEVLARMTHDILTPMNSLLGMAELLLRTPLSDEQRDYATTVHRSGELLLRSFGEILDYSKLDAGELELQHVEFNLAECVEGAAWLQVQEAQRKQLLLSAFIDPQIPPGLLGDPVVIGQMLTNLIVNALTFTERGSVLVSVTLEKDDEDAVNVRFGVKDTGIGVPADAQAQLFEGGSSLGLTVCKRMADLMGGSIGMHSEPGEGATFWFRLRFSVSARAHSRARNLAGTRALVVDAHEFARSVTTRYLTAWGAVIEEAASARDALHILRQRASDGNPYPVVLVDYDLPDQDTFAFAKSVQSEEALGSVNLIMTTTYDQPERGRRAIDAGFAAYMVKPLRQERFFDGFASVVKAETASAAARQLATELPDLPLLPALARDKPSRVLLVEDNPVNQRLARKQLETLGCHVVAAENGLVALEILRREQFDLVLMDLQMPEMDGFAATRQVRKDEQRTGAHVVIVAMTAAARPEDRAACLAAEMDDYLSKPVRLDALRALFEHWIARRR